MELGYIYYTKHARVNTILAVSLSPISDQVPGALMLRAEREEVMEFMSGARIITDYVMRKRGKRAIFHRIERVPALSLHEETFRMITSTVCTEGIILTIAGGIARLTSNIKKCPYPDEGLVHIHVTHRDNPNIILGVFQEKLHKILDGGVEIDMFPEGEPLVDYAIWASTPGPKTPLWWKVDHG